MKSDVSVAKNYLKGNELEAMGRIVNSFLDLADYPVLEDAGKITAEYAKEYAETEFEKYRIIQDHFFQSDFDRFNSGENMLCNIIWFYWVIRQ